MKAIAYPLAAALAFFGLMFVVSGAKGRPMQMIAGVVLLAAGAALIWLARQPPKQETTIIQKIDLSGDVRLENLTCRSCGASLSSKSVRVEAGAIFIHCEYCAATYQAEEEPKW